MVCYQSSNNIVQIQPNSPQFPGVLLLSLSRTHMLRRPAASWKPEKLLNVGSDEGSEAHSILKSCRAVEVPPYDHTEMEKCIRYYADKKWISKGKMNIYVAC